MTSADVNDQTPSEQLTDSEIFNMIWTKPRTVFRYLQDFHYDKYTYLLLFLAAVVNAIERAITSHLGEGKSLVLVLVLAIVAGGIFGVMFYYIYTAVTSLVGMWLGGKASTQQLLRIFAHAAIPIALSLPILLIQMVIFGNEIFEPDFEIGNYNMATASVYVVSVIIEASLALWSFCFAVIGISEVQKFSLGRALGNILLGGLLVITGMMLIVLPFVFFRA